MHRQIATFRLWLIFAVVFSLTEPSQRLWSADPPSSQQAAGKPVSVLSVGNSFSRNATRFLDDLAKAGGQQLIHEPIIVGGASLELHATKAKAHERDSSDQAALYANGKSLQQMLQSRRWDFVTIQQVSMKSHDVATFQPYAEQLVELIRQHAPQAQLLIHQTWAYRVDDPRFTKPSSQPGEPTSQEAMYRGLRDAYQNIARQFEADIIPVGDAFYLADTDPQWGYRPDTEFDFEQAKSPALPDQARSLHVGWRWRTQQGGSAKLMIDGHHANTAGEYLGACVWFEVLFDQSVEGNPFIPADLDPRYAKFLQQTARRAATEGRLR